MLAEMRTALTAEFGFDWVERQPAETEVDQNGYGGDSMLFEYTAPVWQTTTTVRTFEEKSRVVELDPAGAPQVRHREPRHAERTVLWA